MIADYNYYKNNFKGNKAPETDFERIEIKASSQIKMFIMGKDYTNYNGKDHTEQIKMATCSAIDILYEAEQKKKILDSMISGNDNKIIISEKVKDYSRNYATVSYKELQEQITDKNIRKKIKQELELYLYDTGLLNRGVDYV